VVWGGELGQAREGVLDWGQCALGRRGIFFNRNVFDWCVKSTDNTSLELVVRWLSDYIVKFKVDIGVYEKYAKM